MNAITAKIEALPATAIKDMIARLVDDARDEAGIVLQAAMDVLEAKIGSKAFVEFANAL